MCDKNILLNEDDPTASNIAKKKQQLNGCLPSLECVVHSQLKVLQTSGENCSSEFDWLECWLINVALLAWAIQKKLVWLDMKRKIIDIGRDFSI